MKNRLVNVKNDRYLSHAIGQTCCAYKFAAEAKRYTSRSIPRQESLKLPLKEEGFFTDVWSFDENGKKVHPYKGERGEKKGLYSVNFTNDTKNFQGYTQDQLVKAIISGQFKQRGTVRMLPTDCEPGAERNAFGPQFYQGKRVKNFG